jgi:hypothetical protein
LYAPSSQNWGADDKTPAVVQQIPGLPHAAAGTQQVPPDDPHE